jgi:hypothetical protein
MVLALASAAAAPSCQGRQSEPAPASAGPDPRPFLAAIVDRRLRMHHRLEVTVLRHAGGADTDQGLVVCRIGHQGSFATQATYTRPWAMIGASMLMIERPGRVEDLRLTLPSENPNAFKVEGGLRGVPILGSDFSYIDEEILLDPGRFSLRALNEEPCGGGLRCLRVEAKTQGHDRGDLGFDHLVWWLRPDRQEIARTEYFAASGALLRETEVLDWLALDGVLFPKRKTAHNPAKDSRSELRLDHVARLPGDAGFVDTDEALIATTRRWRAARGEKREPGQLPAWACGAIDPLQ